MPQPIATRCFSLVMATLNGVTALLLFLMSRLNAEAGWTNVIVSLLGPAMTIMFVMTTIGWSLDTLRPGVLRGFVPWGREPEGELFTGIRHAMRAPEPLPATFGDRCRRRLALLALLPVRALVRR